MQKEVSDKKEATRSGTRTHNLFLRREAPYPLGHTGLVRYCTGLMSHKLRSKLCLKQINLN